MATVVELAKACNVTPQRIAQLVAEGMPRKARGEYELGTCMAWYIRWLQKSLQAKTDPETRTDQVNFTRERSRLAKEQADASALRNAEKRGDLVSLSLIGQEFGALIAEHRTNVLAFPSKVAPELEGQTLLERKGTLERIAIELLERLVAWRPRADKAHTRGADSAAEERHAATETNGKSVGGLETGS
jgi:phage terminase Nu1 subunit (DNA packaging protein)